MMIDANHRRYYSYGLDFWHAALSHTAIDDDETTVVAFGDIQSIDSFVHTWWHRLHPVYVAYPVRRDHLGCNFFSKLTPSFHHPEIITRARDASHQEKFEWKKIIASKYMWNAFPHSTVSKYKLKDFDQERSMMWQVLQVSVRCSACLVQLNWLGTKKRKQ